MVQFSSPAFDASFAALSDATRRGILDHLSGTEASVSELAEAFAMSLTGMKKHLTVLEGVGLVVTRKVGRVRTCKLGPRRLDEEARWLERHRQRWAARFQALDEVLGELTKEERQDGRGE